MCKRILVVDDSHYVADSFARLIAICGYDVRAVYNGRDALDQFAAFAPDMVLMDIGMPGLDGYQTAAQIRKSQGNTDVVLVAVTCWCQEADKQRAYEHGFNLHVAKPVTLGTLVSLLAMLHEPAGSSGCSQLERARGIRPPASSCSTPVGITEQPIAQPTLAPA